MSAMTSDMRQCIEDCLDCYATCLSTAMNHCLEMGGPHVEKQHFTLMTACAELCRTAAHFMLIGSPQYRQLCRECADLCSQCADDCQHLGSMDRCVEQCRKCAASCRAMVA